MSFTSVPFVRFLAAAAAATATLIAPSALEGLGATAPAPVAQPCYNGVIPWDPYTPSCTLPQNQSRVRGSAPDAQAIIACRHHPGCLAWYVNGPP